MQFQIISRRESMYREIFDSSILEFLDKFLANNFTLSDLEDNISAPLNKGGIADLPLLRKLLVILKKSRKPKFWKVIDTFKNPFTTITNLSEPSLRCRIYVFCFLKTTKVIYMSYSTSIIS